MSFRFFRRMKIAPGVSINMSKSGPSLSFGPRGAKVTVGPKGVRQTVGLPGTGLYYTKHSGYGTGGRRKASRNASTAPLPSAPVPRPEDRLSLGFFRRLVTPKTEEHFVDGMRQFVLGHEAAAYRHFRQAKGQADAQFMAGVLALKQRDFMSAEKHLTAARHKHAALGGLFRKYGVEASAAVAITDEVTALVAPDIRGVLLALAEVHQRLGRPKAAVADLKQLYHRDRGDVAVRLSLAELLVEDFGGRRNAQTVVQLAEGVENDSQVHAALLLYKAKALRRLELLTAARDTLTSTLRKSRDRSAELLMALRYERALVYEALGQKKRARSELEKLYAQSPGYEDAAKRLKLA